MRTQPDGDLMSAVEIGQKLHISEKTVKRLALRRVIPSVRLSRTLLRFRWPDVEAALQRVTVREIGAPEAKGKALTVRTRKGARE